VGSVVGARLVPRLGTRGIVVTGLVMFGTAFAWIASSPTFVSYREIVGQMVLMGTGLGLTSAPATESILSVLPPAKAGVGSAVNDATREAGGTLGVAVIGSVFTSLYAHHLAGTSLGALPPRVLTVAQDSVGAAMTVAARSGSHRTLLDIQQSFMNGLHVACLVAAGVCWLGAVGALALPGRRAMQVATAEPVGDLADRALVR
jgi:hypothetical protein